MLSASALWNRIHTPGYENGICNYYMPGVEKKDRPAYIAKYDAPKTMPQELVRPDICVGQLVSVYGDRIEFAKREFVSGLPLGDDWVVALPKGAEKVSVAPLDSYGNKGRPLSAAIPAVLLS